jgi:hypothetical protein
LTFFDVSAATRHAWCVYIIKFVHAQQILLFQHSASVLLGPQKRPFFDPFLDPLKTPQKWPFFRVSFHDDFRACLLCCPISRASVRFSNSLPSQELWKQSLVLKICPPSLR